MTVDRPMRYASARASGLTEWQARSGVSGRPYRGVVGQAEGNDGDPDLRIAEAVQAMTSNSVLTGWAAARSQGVGILDGRDRFLNVEPIRIASPDRGQHRQQGGLNPTRRVLLAGEVIEVDGVQMATITRAAYDMALDASSLREAVVAIDMCVSTVMRQSRTTLPNVRGLIDRHARTKGIARARRASELASSRSASPWESRTREVARLAGMGNVVVNAPVFDLAGNLAGVADILDPSTGHVIESDGAGHRQQRTHSDDNKREESFERLDLFVTRVGSLDHRDEPALIRRIAANQRKARLSRSEPSWILDKPSWWWSWSPGRRWD